MDTEQKAARTKRRTATPGPVKWATGMGAAAVSFGALSALDGGGLVAVGTVGALILGLGLATEWR